MTDTEKIQNLTELLLEIERTFINGFASPMLAEELAPALSKWSRMKSHYIEKDVDFDLIRDVVCEVCNCTKEAFLYSLNRNHADARRIFVGIVFEAGGAKLEAIGNYLNGRDHSTIVLAKKTHQRLLQNDARYRALFLQAHRKFIIKQPNNY
jgi:chromosomal replication initiation ATPase DnaA